MKFEIQDFKLFSRKLQKIHLILYPDGDASPFSTLFHCHFPPKVGVLRKLLGEVAPVDNLIGALWSVALSLLSPRLCSWDREANWPRLFT